MVKCGLLGPVWVTCMHTRDAGRLNLSLHHPAPISSMAEPVAGPSTAVQTELADVVMTESPPLLHPRPVVGKAPPERPLNVKDALSYLNAVKVQFQHKPDVYNLFLDIMKDFKGQL